MADDARVLIAAGFRPEELKRLERAAARQAMTPAEWLRAVALELADELAPEPDAAQAGRDGAGMPVAGAQEPGDGQGATVALPIAVGADVAILEGLARVERTLAEVCLWAQTVLSELYAHTGFADEQAERLARAKALAKFEKIKASVDAMMRRHDGQLERFARRLAEPPRW